MQNWQHPNAKKLSHSVFTVPVIAITQVTIPMSKYVKWYAFNLVKVVETICLLFCEDSLVDIFLSRGRNKHYI